MSQLGKRALTALFFILPLFSAGQVSAATWSLTAATTSTVQPDDFFWPKQWYLRQINMPTAWSVTTGTRDVIVAVIDGGVDISHQDIRDNIWTNTKEVAGDKIDNDHDGYVDDVHGWNFVSDSADVRPMRSDEQVEEAWSHGTIVSGLIAAKGNDGRGLAGVDWNAKIMPLVILDADGQGTVDDLIAAIRYAANHGAKVINMSLVGYEYTTELETMIKDAYDAGVVIVAATGNDEFGDGVDLDKYPGYPACYDSSTVNRVLGVSALDVNNDKAVGANFGRTCTDLSAPGDDFFVARPSYPHDTKPTSTVPGFIDHESGTSLAAPLVSGVAALLRSIHPDWTPAQVVQRILTTTDPFAADFITEEARGKMGVGMLNAGKALEPDRLMMAQKAEAANKTRTTAKRTTRR